MPEHARRHDHTTQQEAVATDHATTAPMQFSGASNQALQEQLRQRQQVLHLAQSISPAAFVDTGLREAVFSKALTAFQNAYEQGRSHSSTVTIIDYELPSKEKRLWVIDLRNKKLLFHEYTTHGRGSDPNHDGVLDSVSNEKNSHQSNLGLLVTQETYTGRHGKSLRMNGLEEGFNDNARDRAIVFHSARYADDEYIARHGKAGRSHGCPALDPDASGKIIDTIKNGKLVFAYYPSDNWLQNSSFLNGSR